MSEQIFEDITQPRRQHPVASITNVLRTLRELLIPIIIVLIVGGGGESRLMDPLSILILISILFVFGVLNWMRYTYRIEEDELRIEYGVFVRKKLFIPKERIQVIDISSGVVQRMFGLVQVQVQTAGSSSREAKLSAVTIEQAKKLKELLLPENAPEAIDEEASPKKDPDFALSTKRLFIAASTSSSFGVAFSIIGYFFSQLDQFVDDEMMANYIEDAVMQSSTVIIIYGIIAAVIFAWILALLGTLSRYSRFSVKKRKDELVITRGLFERKNITVPFDRVQAVRIVEGILRQPLGYATIFVENAGYGDEGGESTILMPLIKKSEIPAFLQELLPEFCEPDLELEKAPLRSLPRFIIRLCIPVAIITAGFHIALGNAEWLLLLFLPAIFLAYLRYLDTGAGVSNGKLILQFRNLARTRGITKKARVQAATESASWFQRRRSLASFSATVASGKGGRSFRTENLDEEASSKLLSWVSPQ